jgi:hypothetical protein
MTLCSHESKIHRKSLEPPSTKQRNRNNIERNLYKTQAIVIRKEENTTQTDFASTVVAEKETVKRRKESETVKKGRKKSHEWQTVDISYDQEGYIHKNNAFDEGSQGETAGQTMNIQVPLNNIVRVEMRAPSLDLNSTERLASIKDRTKQKVVPRGKVHMNHLQNET